MSERAFQSDELDLEEWERVSARSEYHGFGPADPEALIEGLRKHGHKVDGYMESALTLTLEDYNRVKEVFDSLPDQPRSPTRRKR